MPPTSYASIRDQLPLAMATTSNPCCKADMRLVTLQLAYIKGATQ